VVPVVSQSKTAYAAGAATSARVRIRPGMLSGKDMSRTMSPAPDGGRTSSGSTPPEQRRKVERDECRLSSRDPRVSLGARAFGCARGGVPGCGRDGPQALAAGAAGRACRWRAAASVPAAANRRYLLRTPQRPFLHARRTGATPGRADPGSIGPATVAGDSGAGLYRGGGAGVRRLLRACGVDAGVRGGGAPAPA